MTDPRYEKFFRVQMPRWFRIISWVFRTVGFSMLLVFAWQMTHQDAAGSSWPIAGVFVGILIMILPSLPKAYLEQRNRLRGLRDGSFKEFLKDQQNKSK